MFSHQHGGVAQGPAGGNSAAAMLLSLNFILLSFFIVLVSMASAHQSKKDLVVAGVGVKFARPHNDVSPQPAGPFMPHVGESGWQAQLTAQVLGMVTNRLAVPTPDVEADAQKLTVKLPLGAVFQGARLNENGEKVLPDLVQLGASAGASVEIWLDETAEPALVKQHVQALTAVAPAVPVGLRNNGSGLRVVYRAQEGVQSENLGRLPGAASNAGGEVRGEAQ